MNAMYDQVDWFNQELFNDAMDELAAELEARLLEDRLQKARQRKTDELIAKINQLERIKLLYPLIAGGDVWENGRVLIKSGERFEFYEYDTVMLFKIKSWERYGVVSSMSEELFTTMCSKFFTPEMFALGAKLAGMKAKSE